MDTRIAGARARHGRLHSLRGRGGLRHLDGLHLGHADRGRGRGGIRRRLGAARQRQAAGRVLRPGEEALLAHPADHALQLGQPAAVAVGHVGAEPHDLPVRLLHRQGREGVQQRLHGGGGQALHAVHPPAVVHGVHLVALGHQVARDVDGVQVLQGHGVVAPAGHELAQGGLHDQRRHAVDLGHVRLVVHVPRALHLHAGQQVPSEPVLQVGGSRLAVAHDAAGAHHRDLHAALPGHPHALLRQPLAPGVPVDQDAGVRALGAGLPHEVVQREHGQRRHVAEPHAALRGHPQRRLGALHVGGQQLLHGAAEVHVRAVVDEHAVLARGLRPLVGLQTEVLRLEVTAVDLQRSGVIRRPNAVVLHVLLQPPHGRLLVIRADQARDSVALGEEVADDESSQEATCAREEHSAGALRGSLEVAGRHGWHVLGDRVQILLVVGPGVVVGLGVLGGGDGHQRLGRGLHGLGRNGLLGLLGTTAKPRALLAGAALRGLPGARERVADLVAPGDAHALAGQALLVDGRAHQRQRILDAGHRERREAGGELETLGLGQLHGGVHLVDQSHALRFVGRGRDVVHVQIRSVLVSHGHAQVVRQQQPWAHTARQVAVVEQRPLVRDTVIRVQARGQPASHGLAVHHGHHGAADVAERDERPVDLVRDLAGGDDRQLLRAADEVVRVDPNAEVVARALEHDGAHLLRAVGVDLVPHLLQLLDGAHEVVGHGPVDGVAVGRVVELEHAHTGLRVQ
mmetsp:Transcript_64316/g.106419  ORF Transcript_64316/g.106419 Transcript_64316/m.106419 type:complete len:741 (+) Transcript_64316:2903-5125(+)